MWQTRADNLQSKGLTTKKATCLGDLASRRELTQSQFWSPLWVSKQMWAIAEQAMEKDHHYTVMDNSVGSGRLLAFAQSDRHSLYGCDIDDRCIVALSEDANEAGFNYEFSHSGVENITASQIGIGFVNPPFSVLLSSPNLYPFKTNSYGKFGPMTHANSHEYCLQHTQKACDVTIALLPLSMKAVCKQDKHCMAEFELPLNTFSNEGANVRTAIYVFSRQHTAGIQIESKLDEADTVPRLPIHARDIRQLRHTWRVEGIEDGSPSITLPLTGDNRVELHHKRNEIIIKYHCGLTMAKVANGLLRSKVEQDSGRAGHRYPKKIEFVGSGRLLIEAYMMQNDPLEAFNELINDINRLGGKTIVSPTLLGYFKKRIKRLTRDMTAFKKVVEVPGKTCQMVTAKRGMMLRPLDFTSPPIKKGEPLECREADGGYYVSKNNVEVFYDRNQATKQFDFAQNVTALKSNEYSWEVIHKGKNNAFKEIAKNHHARLIKSGVNFLWQPQIDSVTEAMMTNGAVIGWEQGCGKARAAIALCLSSTSKHNLIVVEGGLVDEMLRELHKIGLEDNIFKVISCLDDCKDLKKINIISYNRLKARLGVSKRTIAHHLRRRFGIIAADEGGILSNPESQQSRALLRLAAHKLFLLDGTPIGSYPRDILPMATATLGSSVAHQPYSTKNNHFMSDRLLRSANYTPRGLDAFRDDFVTLDWASHEFSENLKGGAKREIPLIKNIPKFREWADCVVQRRLRNEPDMSQYAGCKRPIRETVKIKFDKPHLDLYIREAVEFSEWFMKEKESRALDGKGSNLQAVLARIQAVINAANYPHIASNRKTGAYLPVTSKQRAVISRIKELINTTDDKIIVFAKNPATHNRLNHLLESEGIDSVLFTGQQNIEKRTAEMNKSFRFGPCRVLLSTYVGQRGLNLEQANHIIMFNRDWQGSTEEQAIARTTRPDQLKQVKVQYFQLVGSIDDYIAQLVEWKIAAAKSGLDYGASGNCVEEFRHLDSILEKFCKDTLEMSLGEYHRTLVA